MAEALTLEEQLIHLKGLTVRFGSIHEAQILQLRNYPLIIPKVIKARVAIDTDRHIITYDCSAADKFVNTKKNKVLYREIQKWIRIVVWDDTTVEIIVNKKVVYDTRSK